MRIKTPITKARLRNHIAYHWWMYLLAVAASVFGWNLLYSATAYRSPQNLRVDVYIQGARATEDQVNAFLKPVWEAYVPEMETVSSVLLTTSSQDYYGNMQLTVYIMANEGDIYLLSSNDFKSFASQGVFLDLQPFIDSGQLNAEGLDLSAGYVALVDDEGIAASERTLFGIPAHQLPGLQTGMGVDCQNTVLCVTAFNENEENVIRFLDGLLAAGRMENTAE